MNPQDQDRLESSIHRVLRSVPDRRAPAGLQARVLAEIARRQALPWWRKSFAHWPAAIRALFFAGSAVAAAAVASGLLYVTRGPGAGVAGAAESFAWVGAVWDYVASADSSIRHVYAAIPRLWLYGAVALVGSLYALLGAISATAYRAISFARQTA
jgi:hypothetical protein